MRTDEINIRDPYILLCEGRYYLYGTRSATCWGAADGFDCYISNDLKEWEGPVEIFRRQEGFFADRCYWAPECVCRNGEENDEGSSFYLVTTFAGENEKKGIYVLHAKSPAGPFELYSERLTPADWACIDGTVYFEENADTGDKIPYLIFSHSFEDTPDGDMCAMKLSKDLKRAEEEPIVLFSAAEAPWARPVPFAKAEFGMDGDVYFTDGPCVVKGADGKLRMTWSSWGTRGYAVGVAVSESGLLKGPWRQLGEPLYAENGGHGMMFYDKEGQMKFTLHFPNDKYKEHPVFLDVRTKGDGYESTEME